MARRALGVVLIVGIAGAACAPPPAAPARPAIAMPPRSTVDAAPDEAPVPIPRPILATRTQAAPMRLTASDGTGLRLARVHSKGVIAGPVAYTELHLWFDNPEPRAREGRLEIALPRGAAPSRLAVKTGGAWREAEIVEKKRARAIYDDFLHDRQDPVLLETSAGSTVSARVFPILAHERKEIIVGWAHEVTEDAPYVVPLRGLPKLDALDVEVTYAGGGRAPSLTRTNAEPEADYVARPEAGADAARAGGVAAIRVRPDVPHLPDPLGDVVALVDTSASRGLDLDEELDRLAAIAAAMPGGARLVVAAFDQGVHVAFDGLARAFGPAATAAIRDRGALGASNLGRALAWAAGAARARGIGRVLVLSDGMSTAGAAGGDAIVREADLAGAGVRRVDVVGFGAARDDVTLRAIARAGAHPGALVDGASDAARIVRHVQIHPASVDVAVDGASFAWPRRLEGVLPGEERVVYAEVPAERPIVVRAGGAASRPAARGVERTLLGRSFARARIAALESEEQTPAVARRIVELSIQNRVLSPYTALLMLERDEDYARYGVARSTSEPALASSTGGRAIPGRWPAERDATAARGNMWGESFGVGGLGLRPANGAGSAPPPRPEPARATPTVSGRVPAEVIQRVLRGKNDALQACWEGARTTPTGVQERVVVRFVIDPRGAVASAVDAGSTTSSARLVDCVLGVFRSTVFPAPEGSAITVVYPLLFGEGEEPPTGAPPEPAPAEPYAGRMRVVQAHLAAGRTRAALDEARAWYAADPGDAMALDALGEALEAAGRPDAAARAYGSLVDLFPARADLRRFAAERIARTGVDLDVASDQLDKAAADRPDHPSAHHLAGIAHLSAGRFERAFDAFAAGVTQLRVSWGRFPGAQRILFEDLGLAAAAWRRAEPGHAARIEDRLRALGGAVEDGPSLRFVLVWESDGTDVDFHVRDALGNHAYYAAPTLPGGGALYGDVREGYGPECFTVRGAAADRSATYALQAHYYARGPMGFGMGTVQIIDHDGAGRIKVAHRPFVVMNDRAFLDLGTWAGR